MKTDNSKMLDQKHLSFKRSFWQMLGYFSVSAFVTIWFIYLLEVKPINDDSERLITMLLYLMRSIGATELSVTPLSLTYWEYFVPVIIFLIFLLINLNNRDFKYHKERYQNLENGYIEEVSRFAWVWTFFWGPLYFLFKGCFRHTLVYLSLTGFYWGVDPIFDDYSNSPVIGYLSIFTWTFYPFFGKEIVCNHYARQGWKLI